MVRCRVIGASERCASRALCVTGAESSTKGVRENPDGGPEYAAEIPT